MKLEAGKWYKDRGTGKWRVDWVGTAYACGHSECGSVCTWAAQGGYALDLGKKHLDLISEWTEPKLRPFKPEEVPMCWVRQINSKSVRLTISSVTESRIGLIDCFGRHMSFSLEHAAKELEYAIGGNGWKPFGVLEGGE